jgi:hypothetical protein
MLYCSELNGFHQKRKEELRRPDGAIFQSKHRIRRKEELVVSWHCERKQTTEQKVEGRIRSSMPNVPRQYRRDVAPRYGWGFGFAHRTRIPIIRSDHILHRWVHRFFLNDRAKPSSSKTCLPKGNTPPDCCFQCASWISSTPPRCNARF